MPCEKPPEHGARVVDAVLGEQAVEPAGEHARRSGGTCRGRGSRPAAPRTSGAPPGGRLSGPRGVTPSSRRSGSSRSSSGNRSFSSVAAAVHQHERALRLARGGPQSVRDVCHALVARGFSSGVSVASICSRSGSNLGGSTSFSPRCSGSSSASKPGPERRDLEQHAAGLAEVDRAEPEAVDHLGRPRAALDRAPRARPRARPSWRRRPRGARCPRRECPARRAARRRRRGRRGRSPRTSQRAVAAVKPERSSSRSRLASGSAE